MANFQRIGSRDRVRRGLKLSCALMLVCGAAASARDVTADGFGREGMIKVRIPSSMLAPDFLSQAGAGARLVAQYESFAIVEVPVGSPVAKDPANEVLGNENRVLLNAGALDTSTAKVKALRQPHAGFKGRALHMVQFAGPVLPDWYNRMVLTGVEVVTAVPSNSYIVYGTAEQIQALQAVAAGMPEIQWDAEYIDDYKIDPHAVVLMKNEATSTSRTQLFAIQLVKDPVANAATARVINVLRSAPITSEYDILNYHNVIVAIPPAAISILARQPDIISIQPYELPQLFDERQDQIVSGNLSGNVPSGPGYLAWLTARASPRRSLTPRASVWMSPIAASTTRPRARITSDCT